jgi:alkylhydroperoxidase family enzyme
VRQRRRPQRGPGQRRHGEAAHRRGLVREPLFDDAERAALAVTEAATRLADRPGSVTDDIWAEAARHYDDKQLGALVLMVALSNFFNRINTTLRIPAGTSWS